jgi:hypothetical protein
MRGARQSKTTQPHGFTDAAGQYHASGLIPHFLIALGFPNTIEETLK